jgi:hypothetical protein
VGDSLIDPQTFKPVYTAPPRQERGAKPAGPAIFRLIEANKQKALRAAEEEAKANIFNPPKNAEEQAFNNQVYADLEAEKARIQAAYEAEIEAAGGSVAPRPAARPASPRTPAPASPPSAPAPASKYKPGDRVRLRDGRTVVIERINPDGTFDYR